LSPLDFVHLTIDLYGEKEGDSATELQEEGEGEGGKGDMFQSKEGITWRKNIATGGTISHRGSKKGKDKGKLI